jgi:hypothetical protein
VNRTPRCPAIGLRLRLTGKVIHLAKGTLAKIYTPIVRRFSSDHRPMNPIPAELTREIAAANRDRRADDFGTPGRLHFSYFAGTHAARRCSRTETCRAPDRSWKAPQSWSNRRNESNSLAEGKRASLIRPPQISLSQSRRSRFARNPSLGSYCFSASPVPR